MLLTSPTHNISADVTAAALTTGATSWQAIAVVAGLQVIWNAMGLFTEWQSQRTLIAVVHAVPAGLIAIRRDSPGRQVLWLAWVAEPGGYERQSRL